MMNLSTNVYETRVGCCGVLPFRKVTPTVVWREFVVNILKKSDGQALDIKRAQKLTQEWMLEYDMLETDATI